MKKKLSIALFSTPWESVPPSKYGGTELVVYNLAEGLMKRGHRVTVFATGDSATSAALEYAHPIAGYRAGIPWGNELFSLVHAAHAFRLIQKGAFDIVHNHYDVWGFAFEKLVNTACVSTYHRDLTHINDTADFALFEKLVKDVRLVSISKSQEQSAPIKLNWIATVYNRIDINAFEYNETPEDYLVWISRITPHKGAKEAIEAAREAGKKIILAGKVDQFKENDVAYFERDIRPLLDGDAARYVGETDHATKVRILKNAQGFIFPIQWKEKFSSNVMTLAYENVYSLLL